MPVVIDVSHADDQRDVVHRAVQALAEGKVVAFPTETVYGLAASALNETAVARLLEVKRRASGHAFALAVRGADEALDFVPQMPPLAMRLARRCWPGPMTLVLNGEHPDGLMKRLPRLVQQAVSPTGTVGLRVPAHSLILSALRLAIGPLVLSSANRSGEPEALTGQDVVRSLGDDVSLVLDDGRCKFGQPSSVVKVDDQSYQVLRSGVISDNTLRRLASYILLFVCTGNTCRSPMAEALMKRRIAEKIGCKISELEDRGVWIMSAGIAAMAGGRASVESVRAITKWDLDLTGHESQPLSDRLVRFADLILTMTRGHREAILQQWPEVAARTRTVSQDNTDVSDPIGGPQELYGRCADQIDRHLEAWADDFDIRCLPTIKPTVPPAS